MGACVGLDGTGSGRGAQNPGPRFQPLRRGDSLRGLEPGERGLACVALFPGYTTDAALCRSARRFRTPLRRAAIYLFMERIMTCLPYEIWTSAAWLKAGAKYPRLWVRGAEMARLGAARP